MVAAGAEVLAAAALVFTADGADDLVANTGAVAAVTAGICFSGCSEKVG